LTQFKSQWLTLPSSWSQSYKLFTKEEAPLIWTYMTSLAYHEKDPKTQNRYKVIPLQEGYPMQMEGAFIVKKDRTLEQKKWVKSFAKLILSERIQKLIPEKQFQFPIRSGVKLPEHYQNVPRPTPQHLRIWPSSKIEELLELWKKALFE
jgi:thiamine transport system substrate-binding protein